ncbi:RIO1 family regulatory kinase/ATPase domain-containing protein [Marinobacterium lutimaris]|uniref:non-specific serine/threonine protein kinase n=1 Tax=Marinobacterium lutimaris TaxID=568106 RepID=A0A1H6DLZ5_9GAMM|nr:RIO1 family regulatory kinase/ATPase [Marinobacterium lutimaris]SEG86209.1 RIO1 family protein [Marinobacterium lutimaris]
MNETLTLSPSCLQQSTVLTSLQQQFPDLRFHPENLSVLRDTGHCANAVVMRYKDNNLDLVIKDFARCNWLLRKTFARFIVGHEAQVLNRLAGQPGITPNCYRLSESMLAYPFIEGTPLSKIKQSGQRLPRQFFTDFEKLVSRMHQQGLVHLDLRNLGNVLVGPDGKPYCIDFQSAIGFRSFPAGLQRFMKGADITGVYKAWKILCEEPLPAEHAVYLEEYNQVRKRWIFRGYPVARLKRRLKRLICSRSRS